MIIADRRRLLIAATATGLAALAQPGALAQTRASSVTADDMTLGSPDAPVRLIEFGSAACPHCARFHEAVWDRLKANYIDTGRLCFIYREMLTASPPVAYAGFQVARCNRASPAQYFERLNDIFINQERMYATGTMQGVLQVLEEVGARGGLSAEQVVQCVNDQSGIERIQRFSDNASQFNVTGTPTLILNGHKLEDPSAFTYEGLSHFIDEALAAHRHA
jgi:protein-disulfide isomerase